MFEHPGEDNELIDRETKRVSEILGTNEPVKRIRRSQIASALIGAVGFALFIDGVVKLATPLPAWIAISVGFLLMLATGLLLRNLNR
jgi:hypothetical protein